VNVNSAVNPREDRGREYIEESYNKEQGRSSDNMSLSVGLQLNTVQCTFVLVVGRIGERR
jgi:hypothetical protein